VVEHPLHAEPFRHLNVHGKSPGGSSFSNYRVRQSIIASEN